ncbi:MAG: hypothetical protein Q8Q17_02985 [bacterium]|nr:hypothetical protein [bacterium]
MKNKIVKLDDIKSVMQFLKQPTIKMAEALTGVLASDSKDWKLSAGKIVQAVIKGNLLTQLGKEIEKYREEGKIKEDYLENDINRASFKELLKFIDEEAPDEIRFKAIKSIFFLLIAINTTEDEEILAYQLMQTCKKLSSAEILILTGTYAVVKNTGKQLARGVEWGSNSSVGYWAQVVSEKIGHNLPELVLQHEANLIDLKLITAYRYKTNKVAADDLYQPSPYFRLTPLGYKLCEFMKKYE